MKKLLFLCLSVLVFGLSSCKKCTNCNECNDKTLSNTQVCNDNFNNDAEYDEFIALLETENGCSCK